MMWLSCGAEKFMGFTFTHFVCSELEPGSVWQVPVCTECVVSFHKIPDHQLENIAESDRKHAEDLDEIMKDTKSKLNTCEDASGKLESLLSDLQQQHDNARDLIKESFQSYKAMLEKCKVKHTLVITNLYSATEEKLVRNLKTETVISYLNCKNVDAGGISRHASK